MIYVIYRDDFDIDDPTFTSISVMKGLEPTMRDNVCSFVYIMLYLCNCIFFFSLIYNNLAYLPWSKMKTKNSILSKKMDDVLISSLFNEDDEVLYDLLKKNTLHSYLVPNVTHAIVELRKLTKTHNITFGVRIDLLIIIYRVL